MGIRTKFSPLGISQKTFPYTTNQVLITDSTPETTSLTILANGYFKVEIVGGGGAGWSGINSLGYGSYCGGGSGAGFVGQVYLTSGTYNITVGGQAGSSILKKGNTAIITAGGGTNGAGTNYNLQQAGGYGGTLTIASGTQTRNISVNTSGKAGGFSNGNQQQQGGASVYNGYGRGQNSNGNGRTNGFVRITFISET